MARAVELIRSWCAGRVHRRAHRRGARTAGSYAGDPHGDPRLRIGSADDTVLLYGHLDKQPEMTGWRQDLGPWKPVIEGDRLYGRGGADDGYAAFASVLAIEAAQANGLSHTRCVVLDRSQRRERQPRPARLPRGARRPNWHTEPGAVPRLGLPRLRAVVGHHVTARSCQRHVARGDPDRRRAQRRGQRCGSFVVPDLPRAARSDRGQLRRQDAAPRAARRNPSGPASASVRHGVGVPDRRALSVRERCRSRWSPITPSNCWRARGTRR